MEASILLIEDEKRSALLMQKYLERAGFRVNTAFDGQSGLNLARKNKPDLILLDLMLPVISGTEICLILRKETDVPIIMLTAKGSREDKISGLDCGADDYIVKPYDPDEVIGRIKAVLRRSKGQLSSRITCGRLSIDQEKEEVFLDGEQIAISHAQFSVLSVFMRNQEIVLSRGQIIEEAFSSDFDAYERAVDTHIRRLRKMIHRDGFEPIKTVYGGGYKLICASV